MISAQTAGQPVFSRLVVHNTLLTMRPQTTHEIGECGFRGIDQMIRTSRAGQRVVGNFHNHPAVTSDAVATAPPSIRDILLTHQIPDRIYTRAALTLIQSGHRIYALIVRKRSRSPDYRQVRQAFQPYDSHLPGRDSPLYDAIFSGLHLARYTESKGDIPTAMRQMRDTLDLIPGYTANVESSRMIMNRDLAQTLNHEFFTAEFNPETGTQAFEQLQLIRAISETATSEDDEGFEVL
ncbi:hypothetical protein [Spongorhabdus nitratireducens]